MQLDFRPYIKTNYSMIKQNANERIEKKRKKKKCKSKIFKNKIV